MAEYAQMPVSLIERLITTATTTGVNIAAAREARALLSQPTPTAEPDHHLYRAVRIADGFVAGPWMPGERAQISDHNEWHEEVSGPSGWRPVVPATQPRIEDLAPGTRFVIHRAEHWTVLPHRVAVQDGHDTGRYLEEFDPSTIRDVTPPKDAA